MRYKIIANPVAGRGECLAAVPRVKKMLEELGLDYDLVLTERPRHAAELARKSAQEGYDAVVAMGGDGTSNEVLNGLMKAGKKSCALGALCVGRGNDFAYGAGIPHGLEEGCRVLAGAKRRTIDVGRVYVDTDKEPRYFGNGIGIGFDAVVGFVAAKMRLSGFVAYLVAALKTLFIYYKPPTVHIRHDEGEETQPSLMISVMNGQRMGGGFMMAPEAVPDDGLLDLCIVGMAGRLKILKLMGDFMKGAQAGKDPVQTGRTRRITVTAVEGVLPAHADGETLCEEGNKLVVEILPKKLNILTG